MRIGILECDHVDARYRSIDGDYVDMFVALLGRAAGGVDVVPYDVCNGALPSSPDECDGWLATGSRWSVYDALGWISAVSAFVRDIRDAGAPYAGICFGHQLLAQALGGTVQRAPTGWGAGAIDTELEPSFWGDAAGQAVLLYMHQDQVVTIPDGADVVARTGHCPVAAIRVGAMLGVQAHPEFSAEYVDALLDAREERIGLDATAVARKSLERMRGCHDADGVGRVIVDVLRGSGK